MSPDLQRALGDLAGLPLWGFSRQLDTLQLQFGERQAGGGANGSQGEVGTLSLHVACTWRLSDAERILVGSGDLFTPADPDEDPATFDWEAVGASWLDVRLAELAERHGEAPPTVERVVADPFGGVRLTLRGGLLLELFPSSTPTGHVSTEFWRLTRAGGAEADWVVGTFGVEREPPA